MPQVDIITGEARRRTWTQEEKQSILAAGIRSRSRNGACRQTAECLDRPAVYMAQGTGAMCAAWGWPWVCASGGDNGNAGAWSTSCVSAEGRCRSAAAPWAGSSAAGTSCAACAWASAASMSSSLSSSCSNSRRTRSDEVPKACRFRRAIWAFSFSASKRLQQKAGVARVALHCPELDKSGIM